MARNDGSGRPTLNESPNATGRGVLGAGGGGRLGLDGGGRGAGLATQRILKPGLIQSKGDPYSSKYGAGRGLGAGDYSGRGTG